MTTSKLENGLVSSGKEGINLKHLDNGKKAEGLAFQIERRAKIIRAEAKTLDMKAEACLHRAKVEGEAFENLQLASSNEKLLWAEYKKAETNAKAERKSTADLKSSYSQKLELAECSLSCSREAARRLENNKKKLDVKEKDELKNIVKLGKEAREIKKGIKQQIMLAEAKACRAEDAAKKAKSKAVKASEMIPVKKKHLEAMSLAKANAEQRQIEATLKHDEANARCEEAEWKRKEAKAWYAGDKDKAMNFCSKANEAKRKALTKQTEYTTKKRRKKRNLSKRREH